MKQINKIQSLLIICIVMILSSCKQNGTQAVTLTQAEADSVEYQEAVEHDIRMKLNHELKLRPNHIFIDLEYVGSSGFEILVTQDTLTGKYYKW